ncbi:P-loop containing nucleoside triphosphate hydrolase protein [Athelia psychrophila]|uniref:DNA 3'-5' helicase n=1 Tax=Athelia psychrophila TaxID=1759441 RepID=A0A166DLK1_9AGAM|nr:P-loop containing nucleoside triphosphate hydrolase protein [Fibularhizoctonia sp. CBS 109695]
MVPPRRYEIPSFADIRRLTQEKLGYRPCLWQIRVVEGLLKHDKDIIAVAATGSGKTLTFWMPLLFREDGIQIIITPINYLGKQNVDSLANMPEGIEAITVTAKNATKETFEVGGHFDKLWKYDPFTSKVISIIWDEAHCVSKWGEFRPEYKTAGCLRWIIPRHIPFYITSATLPPIVLQDVMSILHMSKDNAYVMLRSNDHSNVHICVREMLYPAKSYLDLAFLIPEKPPPGGWSNWLMPKFVIFFDNISDSMGAAKFLRARLPPELQHMVKWFNANMSAEFREVEGLKLKDGDIWGLCCTDSFGMGVDLPDIELGIQWRASCDLCTLWQRFGRAARKQTMTGTALFLVESKYFDDAKAKKATAAENRKRKAAEKALGLPPTKRTRLENGAQSTAQDTMAPEGDNRDDDDDDEKDEDEDAEDEAERLAFEAGRRAAYEKVPVLERKRGTRPVEQIEPVMDDLINAKTRPDVGCSCKPAKLYFRQDMHEFARVDVEGRKRTRRNRAHIPKYDTQPHNMELRKALHQFRKDETIKVFNLVTLKNIGPSIILSNALLDRIVDCAHVRKISTIDHLKHETQWNRADACG